jgi:hypothetical protein
MMSLMRTWLFPPDAARQEITVEGMRLALREGYHRKNAVDLSLLPVHIPECRSYTVEYRVAKAGEFTASRDENGNIAVRSDLLSGCRFPVCWLPGSFAGKRLDRYILTVDRKRVSYRAGVGFRRAA